MISVYLKKIHRCQIFVMHIFYLWTKGFRKSEGEQGVSDDTLFFLHVNTH
jgi:hypothetical protein